MKKNSGIAARLRRRFSRRVGADRDRRSKHEQVSMALNGLMPAEKPATFVL